MPRRIRKYSKMKKNQKKELKKKKNLFLPPMKSVEALIPVLMYVLLLVLKYFLCRVLSDAKPANATQHFDALHWGGPACSLFTVWIQG